MDWLIGEVRTVLEFHSGISYSFSQPIDMRVQEMIIGARGDVVVKVFGDDINELNRISADIAKSIRKMTGSRDVFALRNSGMRYLTARINRLAAGRFGLNAGEIQDALRVWIDGRQVGLVLEGAIRTPLVIRGAEISRRSAKWISRACRWCRRTERSSNYPSSPRCARRTASYKSFARRGSVSPRCSPMSPAATSLVLSTRRNP